jgi:hypothetical protein
MRKSRDQRVKGTIAAPKGFMHFLFALLGTAFGAGLLLMCRELRRAPEGHQDHDGFHQVKGAESMKAIESMEAVHSHAA